MKIRFRQWINKLSEFAVWGIGDISGDGSYQTGPISEKDSIHEQFIGITDKTGKDIYEGDIVQCALFYKAGTVPTMGVIEYYPEYAAFCLKNDGGKTLLHNHDRRSFEVLGNIHDNLELIKCSASETCI